jgi:hypothetical protein
MNPPDATSLFSAVRRLLRPLVRILLDRGVAFERFADLAREVYVDVAESEFRIPGRKQTVSRVSVLTGLSRKEVVRVQSSATPEDDEAAASYNRAARVVTGWIQDHPMEGTSSGAAPLPVDGPGSFAELVRRYSGDMPVRAVLDELMRVDAVRMRGHEVELVYKHYIPPIGETRKLVYLGEDTSDLISTIGHNLTASPHEARFQRKVFYDNLPVESLPEIRALTREKAERILDELAREMSRHDRDVNPAVDGTGRMLAVVGIYFSEEPFFHQQDTAASPAGTADRRTKPTRVRGPARTPTTQD